MDEFRQKVNEAATELNEIKSMLANQNDQRVDDQVNQVSQWLADIEMFFIDKLKDGRLPPRTFAEERVILLSAELQLSSAVLPTLKKLRESLGVLGYRGAAAGE